MKKKNTPKPKYNMWQNTCYMIALAWKEKEKKVIILSFLVAFFAVVNNLINLYVTPTLLSTVEKKSPIIEVITIILFFVLAKILCSAIFAYLNTNTLFGRISVRSSIITLLNRKGATTSYINIGDEAYTKLLAKARVIVSSNSEATEAIWTTLTTLLENCMGFIVYIILLSSVNYLMLVIILITSIIGYLVTKYVNSYEYDHRDEVAEYEKRMFYIQGCAEDYSLAKDIRIFGIKPWVEELEKKAVDLYGAFHKKVQSVFIWSRITDLVLAFLRNAIAYAYLIHLVISDGLSVAQFLLYFSAIEGFSAWVLGILNNLSILHKQSLDISIAREFIEFPEPFRFEDGEKLEGDNKNSYEICLEDVSFRYPEAEKETLSHINLVLHPGEKIAIVGLNGAGKTTLIKLMCGFLDPTEGRVLLNGQDIRKYNRRDYYKMFSAVFQSFSLLAGSIKTNIAQTEDEANIDMKRVKQCVDKAGLRTKIESLKDKYDTLLNRKIYPDALMLSGGETQRLMLARALYKDAPFIVLDEPTAALDPIAEADMYQKYNEMTEGKSSVYISHRLASTRFCDRIILIGNASIIEEGTHDELLALGGRYAELFDVQSKYYTTGGNEDEE